MVRALADALCLVQDFAKPAKVLLPMQDLLTYLWKGGKLVRMLAPRRDSILLLIAASFIVLSWGSSAADTVSELACTIKVASEDQPWIGGVFAIAEAGGRVLVGAGQGLFALGKDGRLVPVPGGDPA